MNKHISFILLICVLSNSVKCAKILGIFPFSAPSHYILGHSLLKGLAEAGHDVTMISPFENEDPPSNGSYRDIVLTGFLEEHKKLFNNSNMFDMLGQYPFLGILGVNLMVLPLAEPFFDHPNVRKLMASDNKFDAVIVQQFGHHAYKVIAYHFGAPLISFANVGTSSWINEMVANPAPLSYIPHLITNWPPRMSFFQRLQNVALHVFEKIIMNCYSYPRQKEMLNRFYPNAPPFDELFYNVSLVLANSHESLGHPVPLVPNIVQIGGFHVQPPKKLPKDLQDFLDNAKDGVIYFSMGSNLKSKDLPLEKREALLKAFRKLKQKVLWKWEEDVLPDQPSNVKLGKWLPQQDILAHPNVKLFITHGGFGSTIETVYHGVPVLAIPVLGDQRANANTAVLNGFGLSLPYHDSTFSEKKLSSYLNDLIHNPKYTNNAKERSRIFHARPLKPMENAIYWIEYVIRHKGASHLRVAGVGMPWYQYLLLDVFAFILAVTTSTCIIFYVIVKKLCKRKQQFKVKKN